MKEQQIKKHCYNSWSCMLSAAIIAFLLGSVIYDMVYAKPKMHRSIRQIETLVQEINDKMDVMHTAYFIEEAAKMDSVNEK